MNEHDVPRLLGYVTAWSILASAGIAVVLILTGQLPEPMIGECATLFGCGPLEHQWLVIAVLFGFMVMLAVAARGVQQRRGVTDEA